MPASQVPTATEINAEVARRLQVLVGEAGEALGAVASFALAREGHALSPAPTSLWPPSVALACVAAGGDWRGALWPAAALECAMVAADLFDDLADGEATDLVRRFGSGGVITGAAGLLSLAGDAVLRATEDGVADATAVRLGRMLGSHLARAADGQTSSLRGVPDGDEPVVAAYRLAALKSGPLGALAFGLGAAVAGASDGALAEFQAFGWHLTVSGQLDNDTRDVLPSHPTRKRDVLDGVATVPLVFANSRGAPSGLDDAALGEWEAAERRRVAEAGGIIIGELLANADRHRAEAALARLIELDQDVSALRIFVTGRTRGASDHTNATVRTA